METTGNALDEPSATARRTKTPLISWWGIFAVIVFAVVCSIVGSRGAKIAGADSGGPAAFIVGTIIGGILLALTVAWLLCGWWRRSSAPGTVVFSIVLILASLSVLRRMAREHVPRGANLTASYLQMRDKPIVILGNNVSISYPMVMQPLQNGKGESMHSFGLYDPIAKELFFTATVQFAPGLFGTVTMDDVQETLSSGFEKKFRMPEPFRWRPIKSSNSRAITQPLPMDDNGKSVKVIWGVAQVDDRHIVMIDFVIKSSDSDEITACAATAEKIVESVSATK